MTSGAQAFFDHVAARGHEPLLEKATGVLRIDLSEGDRTDRWFISVDHGDITVTQTECPADCTLLMEGALFDRMTRGEVNAMAAVLRGDIGIEGDLELVVMIQRLMRSLAGAEPVQGQPSGIQP
jgi:putative sterol carrier protein